MAGFSFFNDASMVLSGDCGVLGRGEVWGKNEHRARVNATVNCVFDQSTMTPLECPEHPGKN